MTHPDQDGGNGERRTPNGRTDWKLVVGLAAIAVPGLIAWGATQRDVAAHEKKLEEIEPLRKAVAELTTAVAVLTVEVRFLREQRSSQTRDPRRDSP